MKLDNKHIENYQTYYYGNEDGSIVVSVGKGNKSRTQQKLNIHRKDAGKHFLRLVVSKMTGESIDLYSQETSKSDADNVERELKENMCNGYEMKINNKYYKKKDFYSEIIVPQVIKHFGKDSREYLIITMIEADGDSLVSMKSEPAKSILENIINKLQ